MDLLYDRHQQRPPTELLQLAERAPEDGRLMLVIEGVDLNGDDVRKTVSLRLDAPGAGRDRLTAAGLQVTTLGQEVRIGNVRFGSAAKRVGLEPGYKLVAIDVPADRPNPAWFYVPALLLLGAVYWAQRRRRDGGTAAAVAKPA
jgi:hypothetical protein